MKRDVVIAIAGRPNVGKSTLFNRFVGKKMSIVDDRPGVTRDYRVSNGRLGSLKFIAMDTAGLEDENPETILGRMRQQTNIGLGQADIILFLIDGRLGLTPTDRFFADYVRSLNKPVIVCVNKAEGNRGQEGIYDAYQLGFDITLPISAEHATGIGDLEDALTSLWPIEEKKTETLDEDEDFLDEEEEHKSIHVAIVGRPNVGKSTLMNSLLGEERSMTGPEAGITRDAISVEWTYEDQDFRLVDTAGMRKKARIHDALEKMSVEDSIRAIRLAHVVVLMIDGNAILDKQDLAIASHVAREGRAMVIAMNKWDSVENKEFALKEIKRKINISAAQWRDIKVVPLSALYGRNTDKLMHAIKDAYDLWNMRISTGQLNKWLDEVISHHPPPLVEGRPNKIKYMTQAKARPPTFVLNVSRPEKFPTSYERYLTNALKADFGFDGTPIRLTFKTSKNPFADK